MRIVLKHKTLIVLLLILSAGIFLRTFKVIETLGYADDADLYSWIVRDILFDKPIRLIGQETSTEGIFIGPLFYYFLVPFYSLSGLDPLGAVFAALVISIATILSYFFVFKKLFNDLTGLSAAFLQAVWVPRVSFDRWIVPTITVNLWSVWYLLAVFKIFKGELKYLILAFFMEGLIWHVHVALAPLLILIPLSLLFSKKLPGIKIVAASIAAFILPMLPFLIFEARHGFNQVESFFKSFFYVPKDLETIYGSYKIDDVISQAFGSDYLLYFAVLMGLLFSPKLKLINQKSVILLLVWAFSLVGFFSISKKLISEYYFESIGTVVVFVAALYTTLVLKSKNYFLKALGILFLALILLQSGHTITNLPVSGNGYVSRMNAVRYIRDHSISQKYPCVTVTHISGPGEDLGYRYLYWFKGLKMAKPQAGIPNYTIVYPYHLATGSARFRHGAINVIPPQDEINMEEARAKCPAVDYNLTNPFRAFTE